jgi:hypothetical protein
MTPEKLRNNFLKINKCEIGCENYSKCKDGHILECPLYILNIESCQCQTCERCKHKKYCDGVIIQHGFPKKVNYCGLWKKGEVK